MIMMMLAAWAGLVIGATVGAPHTWQRAQDLLILIIIIVIIIIIIVIIVITMVVGINPNGQNPNGQNPK